MPESTTVFVFKNKYETFSSTTKSRLGRKSLKLQKKSEAQKRKSLLCCIKQSFLRERERERERSRNGNRKWSVRD
jgi:hypothetical protein